MSEKTDAITQPLITVIMPCYNAAPFLEEAVDSVMGQTYPMVELILVDDGSTDRSIEIAQRLTEKHPGRITLLTQRNLGPYPARNLGMQHARGEFIAFLDADDWWDSECLERLHSTLTHSSAAVAYCGWQNVGATNRNNDPFIPKDYETENKLELLLGGGAPWPIHAALTRRYLIEKIGGFRTDLDTSLDYELWLRLAANHKVVRVSKALAFYRFHGHGQISSRPWRQAINGWRIKKRFLEQNPEHANSLSNENVSKLVDRTLFHRGMEAYWRGDFVTSWYVFRHIARTGSWGIRDLKYLSLTLLPKPLYIKLARSLTNRGT